MPTVSPTITYIGDNAVEFVWNLTSADADGAPIGKNFLDFADRTVLLHGTFGTAQAVIEGSSDGTNWVPLSDAASTSPLSGLTSATSAPIAEVPRLTRPNLSPAGSGATVRCSILCRRMRK